MASSPRAAHVLDDVLPAASPLRRALGYRKFVRPQQLRVLLLDGAYHLHAEAERALGALGHHVARARADYTSARENLASLLEGMVQHRPDFVLLINHIGLDAEGSMGALLEKLGMPLACWYCDSPMFVLREGVLPAPNVSSLFVWEKSLMAPLRALGAQDVHYLPLGCDENIFTAAAAHQSAVQWPVSFVGDSMQRPLRVWRPRIARHARAETDRLRDTLLNARAPLWQHLLERRAQESDLSVWDMLAVATFEATQAYRQSVLKAVDTPELHIVGDDGWKQQLAHARLHPTRAYGAALYPVYRGSEVSLNATSLQMSSAVNQRVFDVPMAGGFVLSDAQEDLFELFAPQREAVAYSRASDVADKVAYYRNNPELRERISSAARARILKEHTYRHRLARMCRTMVARHRTPRALSSPSARTTPHAP